MSTSLFSGSIVIKSVDQIIDIGSRLRLFVNISMEKPTYETSISIGYFQRCVVLNCLGLFYWLDLDIFSLFTRVTCNGVQCDAIISKLEVESCCSLYFFPCETVYVFCL